MKKTRRTRLTAMMFAAAGVGSLVTLCGGGMLYHIPAEKGNCCATTTTTTTTTAQSACRALIDGMHLHVSASGELMGDVDGNGKIEVVDAGALQHYLHNNAVYIQGDAADLDADGVIDVFDLDLLKRMVIELQENSLSPYETLPAPVYGPPSWFTTTTEKETTTEPQTEYGPPSWFTTAEEETQTEPQDVYGPPEWFTDKFETTVVEEETVPPTEIETETELLIQPVYGPPPSEYLSE